MATRFACYDAGVATVTDVNANNAESSPVRSYEPPPQKYSYSDYADTEEEYTSDEENDSIPYKEFLYKKESLSSSGSFKTRSLENRTAVNQWVDTWTMSDGDERSWTWIHVHAYYSKKKRHGGYGVILRDALGKPITAEAKFSRTGVSFFYQVFKGINAGVTLAEHRKLSDLRVRCNSLKVPNFFRKLSNCSDEKCKNTIDPRNICKRCDSQFILERCEVVMPLVLKLRRENLRDLSSSWELAEHYVSKMEKEKVVLEVEKKQEAKKEKKKKLWASSSSYSPADFPPGLQNILWVESLVMKRMV